MLMLIYILVRGVLLMEWITVLVTVCRIFCILTLRVIR